MADHDETKAKADVEVQNARLETAKKRVVDLRATLWAPKDKVRVADQAEAKPEAKPEATAPTPG